MTAERFADFDVRALHAALDARRQSRGMSWKQVADEVSGRFGGTPARAISPSTIGGLCGRGSVEGDGVLQMLLWLDRTPESFVPGRSDADASACALPRPESNRVLRFDAQAIHAALAARRTELGWTWKQLADDIGGGFLPAELTRLEKGGRVGFPRIMRIIGWLGRPAAAFTHMTAW